MALYQEAALLKAELSRVPEGDPNQAEVYFLGIAGDGTERVFSGEVTAFRDHFDNLYPLEHEAIRLGDLSATSLSAMLTNSGIRWQSPNLVQAT